MIKKTLIIGIMTIIISSCSKNNQENEGILGKKTYEPNLDKRVLQSEGKLLGNVVGKKDPITLNLLHQMCYGEQH